MRLGTYPLTSLILLPPAHSRPVRGIAVDALNMEVFSGSSDSTVKVGIACDCFYYRDCPFRVRSVRTPVLEGLSPFQYNVYSRTCPYPSITGTVSIPVLYVF